MDYVNEFIVKGKVVAVKNGTHPSIRLVSKAGKKETFPLIYCTKKMLDSLHIKPGMRIETKGAIRTFYNKSDNGDYTRRQAFHAESISVGESLCAQKFGVKGAFYDDMSTNVYLSGILMSKRVRDDGWASAYVRVSDSDMNTIKVNFKETPQSSSLQKGDHICLVGLISTVNKTFGEKNYHYENIVVNDIGKIDE